MKNIIISFLTLFCFLLAQSKLSKANFEPVSQGERFTAQDFLDLAIRYNPSFRATLIDELNAKLNRDLTQPLMELTVQYNPLLTGLVSNNSTSWSHPLDLSTTIPWSGTTLELGYDSSKGTSFSFSQPLLKNAFGIQSRHQRAIADLEWKESKLAAVEAYEDLIKEMLEVYLGWALAYFNLQNSIKNLEEDRRIEAEVLERRRQSVALPIDVNKAQLELLGARKQLLSLSNTYFSQLQRVKQFTGSSLPETAVPELKPIEAKLPEDMDLFWKSYEKQSRSLQVVRALAKKQSLSKQDAFWDLLPKVDFTAGYDLALQPMKSRWFAGIEFEYAIPSTRERSSYRLAKNREEQRELNQQGLLLDLRRSLIVLVNEIRARDQIIDLNQEEIHIAQLVFEQENIEYRQGRSSLRELINQVKELNRLRLSLVENQVNYNRMVVEWLRVTDNLLQRDESHSNKDRLLQNQ